MSDDEDEERRRRNAELASRVRDQELGLIGRGLRTMRNWLRACWRRIAG
jgi:hypothetical protein